MLRFLAIFLLAMLALPARGQSVVPTTPTLTMPPQLFRIGFLRQEAEGHPRPELLEGLKTDLLETAAVSRELRALEYTGIGLYACDGADDMLRRLNAREFDLVFAPAALYARHDSGYTPILKSRRPAELISVNKVWRQGVVIVSPRTDLFRMDPVDGGALRTFLTGHRLGVVSTQSVAGYHAALLGLAVDYGVVAPEGGYVFYNSSEEVAKAVISGLVDIGACEESALERVLEEEGLTDRKDSLVKIILRTDRIVTDPVLVRSRLAPQGSRLGWELQRAIRQYSLGGGFGEIQYAEATPQDYAALGQLLRAFAMRVGDIAP